MAVARSGWVTLVAVFFFYRLLDGWAVGGLLTNIGILLILALKQEELQQR